MKTGTKISHTFKARCIKQYKQLEGLLDLGDEITIESLVSTGENEVEKAIYQHFENNNRSDAKKLDTPILVKPAVMEEIGIPKGFRFLSKNGEYYTDDIFTYCLGYVPVSDFLERISENNVVEHVV